MNKQKGFAHLSLLLIVILTIGVGGWWMWKNYPTVKNQRLIEECTKNGGIIGESYPPTCIYPSGNPTADLETYTNEAHSFSFKYPSNWSRRGNTVANFQQEDFESYTRTNQLMKQVENPILLRVGQIFINDEDKKLTYPEQQESWRNWTELHFEQFRQNPDINIDSIRLENTESIKPIGKKLCYTNEGFPYTDYNCYLEIYIPNGEIAVNLTVYGEVKNFDQIQQMLSTFQFINGHSPSVTSGEGG